MKKFLRLFSRLVLIIPAVVLQILWFFVMLIGIGIFSKYINIITFVLQIIIVLDILNQRGESKYRLFWITIVLSLPLFGIWLYLLSGNRRTSKPIIKKFNKGNKNNKQIKTNASNIPISIDETTKQTLYMLNSITKFPIDKIEDCKYYPLGENLYNDLIVDLKNAKHFIFLEYFIIEKGKFWNSIVDILKEKVNEGVEVKILYDDVGSISTHSLEGWIKLKKSGLIVAPFNPVHAIKLTLNNRNHKKMTIIDGKIAYSGGINIADEYINEINRFGHWKDIGFRVTGKSVFPFFRMFAEFWNAYSKVKISEYNYKKYFDLVDHYQIKMITQNFKILKSTNQNNIIINSNENIINKNISNTKYINAEYIVNYINHKNNKINLTSDTNNGFILSYYDSPNNVEQISNKYFISVLCSATKYAYFYTPYLIIGESLKEAFILAAQRGVDVRIIIPGIPDKKIVYSLTKKYAEELSMYGVKIYVYSPGFVHAKASIIDDRICSIGTVNLDYRSLYLHFENNTIFANSKIIDELKTDFLKTQNKSQQIVISKKQKKNIFKRLYRLIIDLFAPLM